jgi:preprotein translocase subunit YajC
MASDRKVVPIAITFYLVVTFGLSSLLVFDPGTANDGVLLWILPAILLGGIAVFLLARCYAKRRSDYVDPEISIEVGDRMVTLRKPGVVHQVDYRDVDFRLVTFKHRGTASFLGMIMQSPFGPLQLQDGWFKHGTAVGAAVIMRWSVADAAHRGA